MFGRVPWRLWELVCSRTRRYPCSEPLTSPRFRAPIEFWNIQVDSLICMYVAGNQAYQPDMRLKVEEAD